MIRKKTAKRRPLTEWQKMKKKAPKVPDITCPDIDSIISKLEKHLETNITYTKFKHKQIVKTLEKLRSANESLRDSGEYWYGIAKDNLKD
jgi:pyruvate/2-oxoglutarate dehydrogenase complex dihydrolipoamide acyltransferase (E2) component